MILFSFADYWWFYAGFVVFVLAMLALDLGVFHKKAHEVSFKEAATWTTVWIGLALLFNFMFYQYALLKFSTHEVCPIRPPSLCSRVKADSSSGASLPSSPTSSHVRIRMATIPTTMMTIDISPFRWWVCKPCQYFMALYDMAGFLRRWRRPFGIEPSSYELDEEVERNEDK